MAIAAFKFFLLTSPLAIVVVLSVAVGVLMVVLFGYTSDQEAIGLTKDQVKAHLLAVRLYRDQIPVVMSSYGKILRGTGRYLKLSFKPLLWVIIPITFLVVQVDRYLGAAPLPPNRPFLLTVHLAGQTSDAPNDVTLVLPSEITMTAPPVHVPSENAIVWRLVSSKEGKYEVKIATLGRSATKAVRVGSDLTRISTVRLRGQFWNRMFFSAEPPLPENFPVESISINYPERDIQIAGYGMNWIWPFFILSMVAGFIFMKIAGIRI